MDSSGEVVSDRPYAHATRGQDGEVRRRRGRTSAMLQHDGDTGQTCEKRARAAGMRDWQGRARKGKALRPVGI